MNFRARHFTYYREARPGIWFSIGLVLAGRPDPEGSTVRLDVPSGVVVSIGSHTFAVHRSVA